MRLKKIHPTLDATSTTSSSSTSSTPPNTLRKPKPPPADTLLPNQDPSASPPRQPSTLKKASPTARAMNVLSSSRSFSSSSSSSSSSSTTTAEAEVVSLNDDPDLKPAAPPSSSSPTKLSQFTFRGWPVSRKPPSTFSPPPSRDGPTSTTQANYWSSVAPTNPQSQAITPSSSAASASSATSTSPSSYDMNRTSSNASTSSSVYSVKVTAPTGPAIHHPFIPKRPYSAPVTSPTPDSLPSSPLLLGEQQRRRATANGILLYQTIPEGAPVTQDLFTTSRPPDHSVPQHGISSPAPSSVASPSSSRTSPSSDQGYAADNDGDSVGSDRSVIQAVTVVNELDKYSLHIKLPGFNLNHLCIASRRDRSLLITADKFDDEVPKPSTTAFRASSLTGQEQLSSSTPSTPSTLPQEAEDPQHSPNTPPERLTGHFERCVQFGPDADPSRASARFDGETLVINVPKKKTWADVDVVDRGKDGSIVDPETPVLAQEKSPRSIALALGANRTSPRAESRLQHDVGGSGNGSGGSGSSAAVSPGAESTAESTTSTTPEEEMTSGSSCTDTSSVPSPMSEDGGSPLGEVSRRLDEVHLDLHDGSDEEDETENHRSLHTYQQQYPPETPTPTSFYPQRSGPISPSYPFSPNKADSPSPSPIASWLNTTSATLPRSRSHSPPRAYQQHGGGGGRNSSPGSDSDSSEGRAAARRHFGIEDDLVTPTPQRLQKRPGPSGVEQATMTAATTATNNHHTVSPKKDYFGFPMTPVLASTPANSSDAEKTTPPKSAASSASHGHHIPKQRSPSQESGPPGGSPSRMPLSLRRGSTAAMDEDVVEHMRIRLPSSVATASNGAPSFAGRTRDQGMGRSAFFWKRWAPGQGS